MLKLISLIFCIICSLSTFAQVNFKLQADGRFVNEDGSDFTVVPFEGKSAHDIYVMLTANVTSIYNDASKVMNTVEDNTVKVRGFADSGKIFPFITFLRLSVEGHYQLEFKIRDGRVRVSAPFIEEDATMTGGTSGPTPVIYSKMLQKNLFNKDGSIKKKREKDVAGIELYVNSIINKILTDTPQVEDDW